MIGLAGVVAVAFAVFEKDLGRFMIQRWKPKDSIQVAHWPTVDRWLRARIALEQTPSTFVVLHMDDDDDMRAYVVSKRVDAHSVEACIWTPYDADESKRRALRRLRSWHELTFPDTIITTGDLPAEEKALWHRHDS